MNNFRKLKVWNLSVETLIEAYQMCDVFPTYEKFGLCDQIRRCAVSIPSNISEGAGRQTKDQFLYFLNVASGSCCELMSHIEVAFRLKYIEEERRNHLTERVLSVYKMILTLIKFIKERK